jgi:prefoldin subunit 5
MITREQVLARLDLLKSQIEELKANIQAYDGAMQDCQYWLAQLDEVVETKVVE